MNIVKLNDIFRLIIVFIPKPLGNTGFSAFLGRLGIFIVLASLCNMAIALESSHYLLLLNLLRIKT